MFNIGSLLSSVIYLISASLLYPTLTLLVAGFMWVVVSAGGFCSEWLERARLKRTSSDLLIEAITSGEERELLPHRVRSYIMQLRDLLKEENGLHDTQLQPVQVDKNREIKIENLIQASTLEWWRSMDRLKIMVRLGPSLGLMGTLIPMGTGLAALGQGDMTKLSSDLVIAFTTTVVGIAIGMTAYCIYTVKRRWIEEDIKNMELATELIADRLSPVEIVETSPLCAELTERGDLDRKLVDKELMANS